MAVKIKPVNNNCKISENAVLFKKVNRFVFGRFESEAKVVQRPAEGRPCVRAFEREAARRGAAA